MKEEFGKWLMDIAKYMVTALLLSSAFGEMKSPWMMALVIVSTVITLFAGLWLVKNKNKE